MTALSDAATGRNGASLPKTIRPAPVALRVVVRHPIPRADHGSASAVALHKGEQCLRRDIRPPIRQRPKRRVAV